MILKINPSWIPGRWRLGVSLDLHTLSSEFLGYDEQGHPLYETIRSDIGECLYRLKYRSDQGCVDDIADTAGAYLMQLRSHPFNVVPSLVIPVPSSKPRAVQPVDQLASAIAQRLHVPVKLNAVRRATPIPELKEILDYTSRLDLLRNAHQVDRAQTSGASVLLVDDLFRSGATLSSVAGALADGGGVRDIFALTVTRTRSNR